MLFLQGNGEVLAEAVRTYGALTGDQGLHLQWKTRGEGTVLSALGHTETLRPNSMGDNSKLKRLEVRGRRPTSEDSWKEGSR